MASAPIALSERDLETMVGIVADAESAGDRADDRDPGLPWSVLHGVRRLVGCDELAWHDLEPMARRTTFWQGAFDRADDSWSLADDGPRPDDLDGFWAHYWEGPCSYPDRSGDLRGVTTTSDFYSQRQWRSTGLYEDYLKPVRHSMLLTLPDRPGRTVRLVAFREDDRPFTERDRAVFVLLRPHIYAAYLQQLRRRRGMPVLTERQWQLLQLVALGHTNAQIARRLGVSEGTVRKHMENIHSRLGVTSRTAALAMAFPDRFAAVGA